MQGAMQYARGEGQNMVGFWWRLFARDRMPPVRPMRQPIAAAFAPPLEPTGDALSCAEIEDRFYRFVFTLPCSDEAEPSEQEQAALRRLEDICGGDRYDVRTLPRMPTVLPQLLRAMKSDSVNGAKLAELIGRDPVLVGEVMRVASSVHYRTLQPIANLRHAVVLLGREGLRHVVSVSVMKPILLASAGMFGQVAGQRLWDHAERCAHACVFLGKGLGDPFEAYLTGLVSNVGIGAVTRSLDKEVTGSLTSYTRHFIAAAGRLATQITLQAARYWELPANVVEVLAERVASPVVIALPLGQVLQVANRIAMVELMGEHWLIDPQAAVADEFPERFSRQHLERCRQDLRRQFRSDDHRYV